jgi:hypothetical protein
MREQEQAILQAKPEIDMAHGFLGIKVFEHLLQTIRMMNETGLMTVTYVSPPPVLESKTIDRLRAVVSLGSDSPKVQATQIIRQSHDSFVQKVGERGIRVHYAYSGDKNDPHAVRTLLMGDLSDEEEVTEMDLKYWLMVTEELV